MQMNYKQHNIYTATKPIIYMYKKLSNIQSYTYIAQSHLISLTYTPSNTHLQHLTHHTLPQKAYDAMFNSKADKGKKN